MTDYLELLLEEQEQEDGEEALGVQLMAEGEPYRRKKPGDKVEIRIRDGKILAQVQGLMED